MKLNPIMFQKLIMEKFIVTGFSTDDLKRRLQLTLPQSKHFKIHAVKNG